MEGAVAPSPLLRLLADSRGTAGLPDTLSLRSSYRDCSPCSQLLALPSHNKKPAKIAGLWLLHQGMNLNSSDPEV